MGGTGWREIVMAKKSSEETFKSWLADFLGELPEDDRKVVEAKITANEKATSKLKDGVLARSEFSSKMDEGRAELDAARAKFDAETAEARNRIAGWEGWYAKTTEEKTALAAKVAEFEKTYGPLEGGSRKVDVTAITEAQVTEAVNKALGGAIKFNVDLNAVSTKHALDFREPLDSQAVLDIATKQNLDVRSAYGVFIADRLEERRKTELDERIKKEREDAIAQDRAVRGFPSVPADHQRPHVLDLAPKVSKDEPSRVQGAVGDFMKNWNGQL
jgi:hypothetical protein